MLASLGVWEINGKRSVNSWWIVGFVKLVREKGFKELSVVRCSAE
jgi:hypothetical protein